MSKGMRTEDEVRDSAKLVLTVPPIGLIWNPTWQTLKPKSPSR